MSSLGVKKGGRNHAVYQRWQVVSSSNRFQSEEVLERDRQRQRAAACDLRSRGGGRHNASPARSHAAALFFGQGIQEDPVHLPPGALQHVARPPSRSMHIMPNNAAGPVNEIIGAHAGEEGASQQDSDEGSSATSSEEEGTELQSDDEGGAGSGGRRRSSKESEVWKPAMPRKHIPQVLSIKRKVEDLPDINTLYEPRELAQLFKCVDAYVHLVLPPGGSSAHSPDMFLASMLASLGSGSPTGRPITPSRDVGGAGTGYLRDREGPLVLRPIFCRFLLASKLCGSRDSPHRYQDCVAAFDAHATRYEAFFGMPRNLLLRVLSGIVLPPGCEASLMASAFSDKVVRQLPPQVRRFLDHHLRTANSHCEARRKALDESISRLPFVESLLWIDPTTLPKVEEDEEKEKDKEKDKEKEKEPPEKPKSRKAERLRNTDKRKMSVNIELPEETVPILKAPEATLRLPPQGMWPPLPPRYVISERGLQQWKDGIRQWEEEVNQQSSSHLRALYENTARVVLGELLSSQLLEPEVLHFASRFLPLFSRIFDEYADEHMADYQPTDPSALASSSSECGSDAPATEAAGQAPGAPAEGAEKRGSMLGGGQRRPNLILPTRNVANAANRGGEEKLPPAKFLKPREGPPDMISFHAFFSFCVEFELFPNHASYDELRQIYDSAETAEELVVAELQIPRRRVTKEASAAAAALLPQVELGFLEKPLHEMTDLEQHAAFFFAALETWLASRFMRLADLVVQRMPFCLEELEDVRPPPSPSRVIRRLRSFKEKDEATPSPSTPQGEARGEAPKKRKEAMFKEGRKNSAGNAGQRMTQLPPSLTLSASELLEIASPPGQRLISTAQLEQCFAMLLPMAPKGQPVEITVYQLDKVLTKAKAARDRASVADCFMLKPEQMLSSSERATRLFLEALDDKILERESRGGSSRLESFFGPANSDQEVSAGTFIQKAVSMALSPDCIPTEKDLATGLAQLGAKSNGTMSRQVAFRALALAREHRRRQKLQLTQARSTLLAQQVKRSTWVPEGSRPTSAAPGLVALGQPQIRKAFRCAAFVECLVKLALHRLGAKGSLELQRGAPTWWKCTWLLNHLGMRFVERVQTNRHQRILRNLVGEEHPPVKLQELDFWWYQMHLTNRPRYVFPLDRLVISTPDLFEPIKAEAKIMVNEDRRGICPECQEQRSPSGWGTPGCLGCSEIESFCLPFEGHIFAPLVRNPDVADTKSTPNSLGDEDISAKFPFGEMLNIIQ